jgi:vacuolar-type H+-ATPase subunit E/Vma4
VRVEAEGIIKDAQAKAGEVVREATKQREARRLVERDRLMKKAGEEANRILAQASVKSRQELLAAKTRVINEIVEKARQALLEVVDDIDLMPIIQESISALGTEKVRIYATPQYVASLSKNLKKDRDLAGRVVEVKQLATGGGIIAEDIEGKTRIDNTYQTRLEMLLPKLLPEISRELFGGGG